MSQTHVKPDRESTTSTPRWAKVFGIAAPVLVLVFVMLHLVDPDHYGPGRHTQSVIGGSHIPRIEHGVKQP
jgi:hypothetical protein